MLTQFLVVLSSTLLTVGYKAYNVFKQLARGPVAGAHLVAVVATATGGSSSRSIGVRQIQLPGTGDEMLSISLPCSTNLRAITDENCKESIGSK